jgi:hypothetical protein
MPKVQIQDNAQDDLGKTATGAFLGVALFLELAWLALMLVVMSAIIGALL